jgi:outer membrane protein assembly factor BamB
MADLGGFDIVLHLRQDVLGDILLRVVNVSLLGQGMTVGQVKRQLTLPPPPATAQAGIWWEQPTLSVGQNGGLRLAVPVRGGVRDAAQQRTLSVGGSLGMSRPIELAAAPDGTPFVRLDAPELTSLDVEDLRLSYADPHTPSLLAPHLDFTRESTLLLPLALADLLQPLARLPISYTPGSLPIRLIMPSADSAIPVPEPGPGPALRVAANAFVIASEQTNAVALGLSLGAALPDMQQPPVLLADTDRPNAALALSDVGMNRVLGQLAPSGLLAGILPDAAPDRVNQWRWDALAVRFEQGTISLAGRFVLDHAPADVAVRLACALDASGRLLLVPQSGGDLPPAVLSAVTASWRVVLHRLLDVRASAEPLAAMDERALLQRFAVPGTDIAVEAPALALVVDEGALLVLYDIPRDRSGFVPELPVHRPQVTIQQPSVPVQTASGAPISATVEAHLTGPSYPPYDYVWAADNVPLGAKDHGSHFTVTHLPSDADAPAATGERVLTTAHLTLMDIFGQTAHSSASVRYQPAQHRRERSRGPGRAIVAAAVAAVIILVSISAVAGFGRGRAGPGTVSATATSQLVGGGPGAPGFDCQVPPSVNHTPAQPSSGSSVYIADTSNLYALDAATGAQRWAFNELGGDVSHAITVAGGVIFNTRDSGNALCLYALNASDGSLRWFYEAPEGAGVSPPAAPAAANGMVFLVSRTFLYALDAARGTVRWKHPVGDDSQQFDPPTVVGDTLYLTRSGGCDVLNTNDGSLLGRLSVGYPLRNLAVAGGLLYFGQDQSGYLAALNASTGAVVWQMQEIAGDTKPVVANGVVYFGRNNTPGLSTPDGYVAAASARDGSLLWSDPISLGSESTPAVVNGVLYFGSDDFTIYALNAATGATIWTVKTGGYVVTPPVIANGVVYIQSDDFNLYALEAATGVEKWRFNVQAYAESPAVGP